jgi:uncharacterized repeat protein (TIGR01451 family)
MSVSKRLCKYFTAGHLILSAAIFFVGENSAWAQGETKPTIQPYVFDRDIRTLPPPPPETRTSPPERIIPGAPVRPPLPPGPADPLWKPEKRRGTSGELAPGSPGGLAPGVTPSEFLNPSPNIDSDQPGDGPPDDNGAVGPNHYIQIVNFTFEIFDKNGSRLAGPTDPRTLWSSAPADDDCRVRGRGDPYVLYDHLADRWIITQFANHLTNTNDPLEVQCIAVSRGPNPVTDGFFAYTFQLGVPNDYPKLAVWPDGYYLISQRGYDSLSSLDAWVFDRANMLNGNPATFQHPSGFPSEHDVIALPSDLTGPPPPAGSPNFYVRAYDGNLYSDGAPRLEIFEFHTDWGVPANTTFKLVQTLTPAPFRSDICDGSSLDQFCVPQPGAGTSRLDALSIWPMGPAQYRNFGDHETLLFTHTVNVDGNGLAGIRWYELRRRPVGTGNWVIYQQETFSPYDSTTTTTTSIHRWAGSIAMDQAGNIALGYNVSNDGIAPHPTVNPGVRVVGRLASDPPGEMTTPEVVLANGGRSATCKDKNNNVVGCRWGDYSSIRVDPADGCTFWYTTEYLNGTTGQQTHVGAVRFPTCNTADLAIRKTAPGSVVAGGQLTYSLNVTNNGPSDATNVVVTDTLPGGTTFLTSSVPCTAGGTCTIGNLAHGASAPFTITVRVSASLLSNLGASATNLTNTATVQADQLDPDSSNNTAAASTLVTESADMALRKTCKPDIRAQAGSSAFCDIQVSNLGVSDAQNVVVTDAIVSNASFTVTSVTGTAASCTTSIGSPTSATVTCNLLTVAAGGGTTIHVAITSNNPGDINDTATVRSTTPDPVSGNNSATGKVHFFASADLAISKTATPNPVVAGTNVTYTIAVSNAGPSSASNVVVKDTLSAEVRVLTVTPSVGSCTAGIPGNPLQPLTCTIGSMATGGSATITVMARVDPSVPDGTVINNNGTVGSAVSDPNNGNNSATAALTVNAQSDLAITKTSDQASYKPSSVVTYTVSVTNNGPSNALAVIVTDNLPTNQQALYQSDTGGCVATASAPTILTCNLGSMPVGTSKSFNIYELIHGAQGNVSNTANVTSSTTDPNLANNTSVRTVTIGP